MFSERLKERRKEKRLTQKELSERLNVSKATVAMWETGKREPDFAMTQRLADFFGVSTDYLIGKENKETPQLDAEAQEILDMLNQLNEENRTQIFGLVKALASSQKQ